MFKVIIPARYASERLPGKPLRLIAGKPMIQHVYERASKSGAGDVIIATDSRQISDCVESFGAKVCMTSDHHKSGTERLSEVVEKLKLKTDDVIVNVQGDEPMISPQLIDQVASGLIENDVEMATLCDRIEDVEELFDPNVVKVCMDKNGVALTFSRAVIPWHRDSFNKKTKTIKGGATFYRHIGLYAYRAGFINQYVSWDSCEMEQAESLEQLRVLWHGGNIHVSEALVKPGPGVDTEDDLIEVERLLTNGSN